MDYFKGCLLSFLSVIHEKIVYIGAELALRPTYGICEGICLIIITIDSPPYYIYHIILCKYVEYRMSLGAWYH